jgi:Mg2+/Co2+ transporter CorB
LTAASRARMHSLETSGDDPGRHCQLPDRTQGPADRSSADRQQSGQHPGFGIGNQLLLSIFGDSGVALATLIMTLLLVVFAEVLPKSWAISTPDRFAMVVSPVVKVFVLVVGPLSSLINWIVRKIMALFGVTFASETSMLTAHEEIRGAVDLLHREGSVVKTDRDRLGGVLDLGELEVSDVMIHRTSMRMLNADETSEANVRAVLDSPYTRMPIWRGSTDNIIGIVHAKDVLRALADAANEPQRIDVTKIAQKPWFVPDTTSVPDQLNAFLRRKAHIAIVVDEYGEVEGLVTLEDILEEIVGEIADEHDTEVQGVRQEADGSVVVDGWVPIRDLNRALDWSLPDDEATTVAGLVIHESQTIPEEKQAFTFHGKRFIVMKRDRNRISRLRIRPADKL